MTARSKPPGVSFLSEITNVISRDLAWQLAIPINNHDIIPTGWTIEPLSSNYKLPFRCYQEKAMINLLSYFELDNHALICSLPALRWLRVFMRNYGASICNHISDHVQNKIVTHCFQPQENQCFRGHVNPYTPTFVYIRMQKSDLYYNSRKWIASSAFWCNLQLVMLKYLVCI